MLIVRSKTLLIVQMNILTAQKSLIIHHIIFY